LSFLFCLKSVCLFTGLVSFCFVVFVLLFKAWEFCLTKYEVQSMRQ
jgi:hypothetical protein